MTDVEIISRPPIKPPRCPCGWRDRYGSRARHAHWHLSWAAGVPIPASLPWAEGSIAVIRSTSPVAWRKVAHQCARIAQRDGGYDSATFPAPFGRGVENEEHARAFCYRMAGGAVGYLAMADIPTSGRWDFIQRELPPGQNHGVHPSVLLVFTAFNWRRLGIARALVEAAAEHAQVGLDDIAWMPRFSEAGRELARNYAGQDGQVWIA